MYESQYLLELGRAVDYLLSFAVSMAAQEALKLTILSGRNLIYFSIHYPSVNIKHFCIKLILQVLSAQSHGQRHY